MSGKGLAMTESGLLEQVKAARALGDLFAPPIGSLVYTHLWGTPVTVVGTMNSSIAGHYVLVALGDQRKDLKLATAKHPPLVMYLDEGFTVLEVPEGSLPFEDWSRPGASTDWLTKVNE